MYDVPNPHNKLPKELRTFKKLKPFKLIDVSNPVN